MTFLRGDSTRVVHPLFQTEDGGSIPTSPLQLHLGRISVDLAISLNGLWHSRLPDVDKSNIQRTKHLVCFGAEYANVWYASAIWTNPISPTYANKPYLELRRFAIAPDGPPNMGSRVLSVMTTVIRRSFPTITKLISYQDTDVHLGTIYAAAGWDRVGWRKGGKDIWTTNKRSRSAQQADGDKVRWEKDIRTSATHQKLTKPDDIQGSGGTSGAQRPLILGDVGNLKVTPEDNNG